MGEAAGLGHNQPPSQIDFTAETASALNAWLTEHPVIQTEEMARGGKLLIDRAASCIKDLEAERVLRVRPLNEQVAQINLEYRDPKSFLEKIANELRSRLNDFIQAEAAKREEEARKAREAAQAAERKAREAEEAEISAREEARAGVVADLGAATQEADQAFAEYRKAERVAARAEKDQRVRIGGGFRRALSLRRKETLIVEDPARAVQALGWTDDMIACILKAARAYRALHGNLPAGVTSHEDRSI